MGGFRLGGAKITAGLDIGGVEGQSAAELVPMVATGEYAAEAEDHHQ